MVKVKKRDGRIVDFDKSKIKNAILKSMKTGNVKENIAASIADDIENLYANSDLDVVEIKDIEGEVFNRLISKKQKIAARAYEGYRSVREYQREKNTIDDSIRGLFDGSNTEVLTENSNKNEHLISTSRDLVAEEVSKDYAKRFMLPPNIVQAHEEGIIHWHDLGHTLNRSFNCCLVNLKDMLDNGTCINGKMIESPHRFLTACTITTQIVAQVASGQFGGQTISIAHLSPYLRKSKIRIENTLRKELEGLVDDSLIEKLVDERLHEELSAGVQTFNYQVNTLQTSNGQSPFLSVFMYIEEDPEYEEETAMIVEEFLKQRLQGMKNEVGAWITPAFPKLLYVTTPNNIYEGSKYYYITELAAKCIAKRMMPDLISEKHMKLNYEGNVFGCMGCRAWLAPYKGGINNEEGKYKWYGRFNMGVTSINLADCGLSADGDIDKFWEIFDSRLELCKESLIIRYNLLKDVTSDVSPIHYQYGAIARLPKGAPIRELLQDGYATITLGYIGVYECVMALIGQSNTTPEGEKLALQIVQHMKDKTLEWKKETGLGFALYGTPSESLTEKFAKACQRRFGIIPGITDHDYLTNSYHVNVREEIDPFKKLAYEAQFHKISSGGCISYIEMANMTDNIPAVIQMMQYMYETIQYAEFNTKSDYCQVCGFDGEILSHKDEETGEWYWECPNCHNRDKTKMNVVRRTCGYLGENFWNEGRTEEIHDRYVHLDNHNCDCC
jgi:ribonucleoside-triphosphate reductase